MKFYSFSKIVFSVGLLSIMILLTACPYSSSVPIDEGTVAVPADLAGHWISSTDKESVNPSYYIITVGDKFHASTAKMEFSTSDSTYKETIYNLTFSNVGGEVFMNAIEAGSETYNLYKFDFDPITGELKTNEITDYIKETFSTSEELKAFILKNKSNSYFYTNTSETYIRK